MNSIQFKQTASINNQANMSQDQVKLSKLLSYTLRHGAAEMNLRMKSNGYVSVDDILNHKKFRGYTFSMLQSVVQNNDKKRFEIAETDGQLFIRATQGHTIKTISDDELLQEITDPEEIPICIHGTYKNCIGSIMKTGLNKMSRNHIHMATDVPNGEHVISGARTNVQILIYIDVPKAMNAGIRFFRSNNGVILSPGLADGSIPSEYFSKVYDRTRSRNIFVVDFQK